jgi:coproporphyrinogen III oxidase
MKTIHLSHYHLLPLSHQLSILAAKQQGEKYFYIPILNRHRGVSHFYLENFSSGDFSRDVRFAEHFGKSAIDTYINILKSARRAFPHSSTTDIQTQLEYHTLYFFQVLTLDRGTTSGLLVHNENDIGILGSLPSFIDRKLLASWQMRLPHIQADLVGELLAVLPEKTPTPIDDQIKARLAETLRQFYHANPIALDLLARGDILPPTTANHQQNSNS